MWTRLKKEMLNIFKGAPAVPRRKKAHHKPSPKTVLGFPEPTSSLRVSLLVQPHPAWQVATVIYQSSLRDLISSSRRRAAAASSPSIDPRRRRRPSRGSRSEKASYRRPSHRLGSPVPFLLPPLNPTSTGFVVPPSNPPPIWCFSAGFERFGARFRLYHSLI